MPTHSETRRLPYTAQQMYDLVADVENYPHFLPWTAAARVCETIDKGDHTVMLAELVISFKVFRERFGSQVTLWPGKKAIDTEYLDGPFSQMVSTWRFEDAEQGSDTHFHVDFEFRSKLLQATATLFFSEAMHRVVHAFEMRAAELYG